MLKYDRNLEAKVVEIAEVTLLKKKGKFGGIECNAFRND
jgi:hypothetical protein